MLKDVTLGRRRCRIHFPERSRDALERDGVQPAIGQRERRIGGVESVLQEDVGQGPPRLSTSLRAAASIFWLFTLCANRREIRFPAKLPITLARLNPKRCG